MKAIDFSLNSFQNIASVNSIIDYTANIQLFITDFGNNPIISQQLGMLRYFIRRDPGSFERISYLRILETYAGPQSPFEVKNGTKLYIFFIPKVNDILYFIKIS